jgi:hypothetical protein
VTSANNSSWHFLETGLSPRVMLKHFLAYDGIPHCEVLNTCSRLQLSTMAKTIDRRQISLYSEQSEIYVSRRLANARS